jgi:hypothetical protein
MPSAAMRESRKEKMMSPGETSRMELVSRPDVRRSRLGRSRGSSRVGGGETTQLLCGYLGSDHAFGPLLSSLPAMLKVDVRATPLGAWVESSFRFAVSQIAAGRVGSTTVIAKLSELLFVEAVSHYIEGLPEDRKGWLAGLRDAHIGRALALMHAQPAKDWSAEALAAEVGMSRSGLGNLRRLGVGGRKLMLLLGAYPEQFREDTAVYLV